MIMFVFAIKLWRSRWIFQQSPEGSTHGGGREMPSYGTPPAQQLDFYQAMADFKVMFPNMDEEIIEAVLRANNGGVDATIDQLLTMSIDTNDDVQTYKKFTEAMAPDVSLLSENENLSRSCKLSLSLSLIFFLPASLTTAFPSSRPSLQPKGLFRSSRRGNVLSSLARIFKCSWILIFYLVYHWMFFN